MYSLLFAGITEGRGNEMYILYLPVAQFESGAKCFVFFSGPREEKKFDGRFVKARKRSCMPSDIALGVNSKIMYGCHVNHENIIPNKLKRALAFSGHLAPPVPHIRYTAVTRVRRYTRHAEWSLPRRSDNSIKHYKKFIIDNWIIYKK